MKTRTGRANPGRSTQFFKDCVEGELDRYTFLVAGLPGMVEGMQEALAEAGVEAQNVAAERYSGY